ncbi:hypothetical protein ACLMJK_002994 [Lecanora helva]
MAAAEIINLISDDEEDVPSRSIHPHRISPQTTFRNGASMMAADTSTTDFVNGQQGSSKVANLRLARSHSFGPSSLHTWGSVPRPRTLSMPQIPAVGISPILPKTITPSLSISLPNSAPKKRKCTEAVGHDDSNKRTKPNTLSQPALATPQPTPSHTPSPPASVTMQPTPSHSSPLSASVTAQPTPCHTSSQLMPVTPQSTPSRTASESVHVTPQPTPSHTTSQSTPVTPQPTTSQKSILWTTPIYKGPDANTKYLPLPHPPSPPPSSSWPNPPTTTPTSHPSTSSTTHPPPTIPNAPKKTHWTCHQLRRFAQDLQNNFDVAAFGTQHGKTRAQVLDAFEFLVFKPFFAYADEGRGVARRFEREMREDRREGERVLRVVNREEGRGVREGG